MNPNASLKSLKTKVRAIASRPGVSVHPGNPFRADFLASADSRSTMIASRFPRHYPNTDRHPRDPCHNKAAKPVQSRLVRSEVLFTLAASRSRELLNQNHTRIIGF